MQSHAERFLVDKACASPADLNLVALNGGKYCLKTDQQWDGLRRAVHRDCVEGRRNFLVEHKTPVFKLFFDIDFAHATLGLEYVLDTLLPCILQGVEDALDTPVVFQDVLVATSPPKQKGELTKTGVHIHWLQLEVTDASKGRQRVHMAVDMMSALAVRESVLNQLGSLPDQGLDFKEVVDERVLKQNGIRMMYSQKCSPCEQCLSSKRQAARDHPCTSDPKAVSFWRCRCSGCTQAKAACRVRYRIPFYFDLHPGSSAQ